MGGMEGGRGVVNAPWGALVAHDDRADGTDSHTVDGAAEAHDNRTVRADCHTVARCGRGTDDSRQHPHRHRGWCCRTGVCWFLGGGCVLLVTTPDPSPTVPPGVGGTSSDDLRGIFGGVTVLQIMLGCVFPAREHQPCGRLSGEFSPDSGRFTGAGITRRLGDYHWQQPG
jgi:hypothetical protein